MSYKLTYFNIAGRGEPIRMLFALAKVDFTDNRIEKEDWPALKSNTRWGTVPILQVGDKEIGQSVTILRFLARKFNLAGMDEWESMRCDEIIDALTDFAQEYVKFRFGSDKTKQEECKAALVNTHIPRYLGTLEKMQKENGGIWLVGNGVTWADLYLSIMLDTLERDVDENLLNSYPQLKKMKEAYFSIPEIKQYVENRPS